MSFVLPGGEVSSAVVNANYQGLIESVAKWLNRTDLDNYIPDFVRLAEEEHRRDVRVQAMEDVATGALSQDVMNYPVGFLEARLLTVGGKGYDYMELAKYRRLQSCGSTRRVFTHVGQTIEVLGGQSATYILDYWKEFTPLSDGTDTNWLLQNAYDVYLWKAVEKGCVWLRDADGATAYRQLYNDALAKLNQSEYERRYSGSILSMQSPGVV